MKTAIGFPYTAYVPSGPYGTHNVQLTAPTNVTIQWPSLSGNTAPVNNNASLLKKLFA